MKITFYTAFAAMVVGAIVAIMTTPALFSEPSAFQVGVMIWSGILLLTGLVVVRLLKNVATKEI